MAGGGGPTQVCFVAVSNGFENARCQANKFTTITTSNALHLGFILNQNVVTKNMTKKSSGGQSAIASHDFTVVERKQRKSSARAAQEQREQHETP